MVRFAAVCLMFAVLVPNLHADMGAIVPAGDVSVEEPGQKALIFHNGREQILVLSTDIRSDKPVSIVRFIPFPSEPKIGAAPAEVFRSLSGLIRKKGLRIVIQMRGGHSLEQPAEIVSRKRLGAHSITVIRVNDLAGFVKSFRSFAEREKLPIRETGNTAAAILADYIARGYRYIVLDRVDLTGHERSVDPVSYRFACTNIYYPLKTSNSFGGTGLIQVAVVAPTARPAFGFPEAGFHVSTTALLGDKELKSLDPNAPLFFRRVKNRVFQVYEFRGPMDFQSDLTADPLAGVPVVTTGGGLLD